MWKRLLPVPFVILAVVVAIVAFRSPRRQADSPSASPTSSASPVPSGSAIDAPLTKQEQQDISIRLNPGQCHDLQKRVEAMPNPAPGDPKSLMLMAACMRHGNVAFAKCANAAETRTEIQACWRRFLFNELSP